MGVHWWKQSWGFRGGMYILVKMCWVLWSQNIRVAGDQGKRREAVALWGRAWEESPERWVTVEVMFLHREELK